MIKRAGVAVLWCLACVASLSACDRLQSIGRSDEDRINEAVPVPGEVLAARKALDDLAATLPAGAGADRPDSARPGSTPPEATPPEAATSAAVDADAIDAEYQSRLKVRALECAHGYSPPALSGPAEVRAALTDQECFARADAELLQWLGQRRVGLLLAAPPLRKVPDAPAGVLAGDDPIGEASFADRAGIALLQGRKAWHVLDMGTGQEFPAQARDAGSPATGLSPNGRLFVTADGEDAQVRESATGQVLATLPGVRSWQVFWVGDVGAIHPDGHAGLSFLDFGTGQETAIPMTVGHLDKVVALPGGRHRYGVFAFNRQGVVELRATTRGWTATLLSEEKSAATGGWSRNTSGLTADGKRLYGAAQSVQLVELPSMQLRTVTLDPFRVQQVVATPDPDRLLVGGYFRSLPAAGRRSFVYAIGERTLAEVETDKLLSTRVLYIPSLRRNALIDGGKVVLLEGLPTGEARPVDEQLQRVQAALAAQLGQRQEQRAALFSHAGNGGAASARAATGAATLAGASPTVYPGPVSGLARDADVEAVGVYEGADSFGTAGSAGMRGHRTGTVHVHVRRGARPVVLVLSSYEPVHWVISLQAGARLAAVLGSSYYPGTVTGNGDARVYRIGNAHAYKRGTADFAKLDAEVMHWTGKSIGVFQGEYTGSAFTVGH